MRACVAASMVERVAASKCAPRTSSSTRSAFSSSREGVNGRPASRAAASRISRSTYPRNAGCSCDRVTARNSGLVCAP
jgi:hypothetical protein